MDEEVMGRGIVSVTPEIIKTKGGVRRNSTGKETPSDSSSLSNSDEKVLPHYLRASTGSCHDFCKYGRKHAFEASGKHPIRTSFLGNHAIPDEKQKKVSGLAPGVRRKNPVIKPKTASQLETEVSNKPKVVKQKAQSPAKEIGSSEESTCITLKSPSPIHKSIASTERAVLPTFMGNNATLDIELNRVRSLNQSDRRKTQAIKLKTTPQPKKMFSEKPKVIEQKDKSPANEIGWSGKPNVIKKKSTSPIKKTITPVKPKMIKQKTALAVKNTVSSAKLKIIKPKTPPPNRISASAKPIITLKPKIPLVKSTSSSNPSGDLIGQRKLKKKTIKSLGPSRIGDKKVLKSPAASLSPKPPVNRVSSLKPRKYMNTKSASPVKNEEVGKMEHSNDKIEEITLNAIEPEPEKIDLEPLQQKRSNYQSSLSSQTLSSAPSVSSSPSVSSHEEEENEVSEYTFSEASESVSDYEGTESNDQVEFAKGEGTGRLRRAVHPEDKFPTPHKLKFRRGKVVDLQSENNGPRRLRFRRGRVVTGHESGKGEGGRRSFRRRDLSAAGSNNPDSETQNVVLRHQDAQGKKDAQGLFNLVIEETASKLVETRKSKVKALVGAFETVISLQETKPPSTA